MNQETEERAHSKFSASGSEIWLNCAASVEMQEGLPNNDTVYSLEGTLAHDVLERILHAYIFPEMFGVAEALDEILEQVSLEMAQYCQMVAKKIIELHQDEGGELIAEQRIYQTFIHPEMFGTVDAAIVNEFGTLHIIDLKYGTGQIVSPIENTQMIQYALGYAEKYDWNFATVKMHIMQPRSGKKWHKTWEIETSELKEKWVSLFKKGVARVERGNSKPFPGSHCYWCKANKAKTCPAKQEQQKQKSISVFNDNPLN